MYRPAVWQFQGPRFLYRRVGLGSFDTVAQTIQTVEGWFPGSLSQRNNNPGNLRPAGQPGCTPVGGFCSFASYQAGYQALLDQISLDAARGETIGQFLNKYAPAQDSNNPTSYAATGGTATGTYPAIRSDFNNCWDKDGEARIGAFVPRADAICGGSP